MNKTGTFIGGTLLIAGSCIGAGMLALPIATGLAGFIPSVFSFLIAWGFMTLTGLLLVEVQSTFKERVNIGSMAERAMGPAGRIISWVLYLFLFYSLLIAYISGSGSLAFTSFSIPKWLGSTIFTIGFGLLALRGTRAVDHWNRLFMFGKIATYLGMVILGFQYIQPQLLSRSEPLYAFFSLPVLVIAFGFHNMIPTLMTYMNQDAKKVRQIILAGSIFALVVYLIWDIVVLGIVPVEGEWGILESLKQGRQASDAVAGILGLSWVSTCAEGLAFFRAAQFFPGANTRPDPFSCRRRQSEIRKTRNHPPLPSSPRPSPYFRHHLPWHLYQRPQFCRRHLRRDFIRHPPRHHGLERTLWPRNLSRIVSAVWRQKTPHRYFRRSALHFTLPTQNHAPCLS
jgi:tyrosine-specific transport protein